MHNEGGNPINQDQLQNELEAVRVEYENRLPEMISEVEVTWRSLEQDTGDLGLREHFHHLIHRLAGSGKTFGFVELSEVARDLERRARAWIRDAEALSLDIVEDVREQLLALREACGVQEAPNTAHLTQPVFTATEQRRVFLVEDDLVLAEQVALQLRHFGYEVECFGNATDAVAAINRLRPDAILVDVMLPEGDLAGATAVRELREQHPKECAVVFVSVRSDFEARLGAVRAGGDAYFVKPLDVDVLVEKLDRLTHRRPRDPFRVLIVDDEFLLTEHYRVILEQAGMEVWVVNRAEDTLEVLGEFAPDLVLMDVYMPGCDGIDLTRLIRQHGSYVDLPVVYLSTESDMDAQLLALGVGGDEFLTKPIDDGHLVRAVAIRAERAREISALISEDSLTGLLKHTRFKEQVGMELARMGRNGEKLSLVMLDIDGFKTINDEHGHLSGDRVIKSLAHLLKYRVRLNDRVGRYGGDELAVTLPGCDARTAARIMDAIRADFADLSYSVGQKCFNASISVGVAECDPGDTPEDLIARADAALYEAKQAGKNRVAIKADD